MLCRWMLTIPGAQWMEDYQLDSEIAVHSSTMQTRTEKDGFIWSLCVSRHITLGVAWQFTIGSGDSQGDHSATIVLEFGTHYHICSFHDFFLAHCAGA